MKPETKSDDEDGGSSPLNLSSLKHAIETIDIYEGGSSPFNLSSLKHAIETIDAAKESTSDLSSLSSAIRKMKQTEKSERKRVRDFKKKRKLKFVIGVKPDTNAELRRWLSNFNESFKQTLIERKNDTQAYKVTPKEPQICEFNTDFTTHHFSETLL